MSAKVLATITEQTPWGATTEPPPVLCDYCHEAITHDGETWTHVRTGLSAQGRAKECHPLCRDCDREGLIAIGVDQFVGSGVRFVVDHFLCQAHARGTSAFIERT